MVVDHSPNVFSQTRSHSSLDPSPLFPTPDKLLQHYLLACQVESKSPLTISSYEQRLSVFLKFISPQSDIRALTPVDIRTFFLLLQQRNQAATTRHAYYRSIRTWFNWLIREGYLERSPMVNVKPPKLPKPLIKPFSREDIDRFLYLTAGNTFLEIRGRLMILILMDTGLRFSELANLQLKDFSPSLETITVFGKGNKERQVRIGKETQKAMLKYITFRNDQYPCLWITEERRPMTPEGVKVALRRLGKRAEITDAKPGPHTFRHTCAINYLRNGGDQFTLQILLGHASLEMTRRYVSTLGAQDMFLVHQKASPVDCMMGTNKRK